MSQWSEELRCLGLVYCTPTCAGLTQIHSVYLHVCQFLFAILSKTPWWKKIRQQMRVSNERLQWSENWMRLYFVLVMRTVQLLGKDTKRHISAENGIKLSLHSSVEWISVRVKCVLYTWVALCSFVPQWRHNIKCYFPWWKSFLGVHVLMPKPHDYKNHFRLSLFTFLRPYWR